jgi:hypothetical protein
VRPGRKNGGTTFVFRLTQPTLLRITVMRVYPTCKRIGTFTVRGRAGLNRIAFRGRVRGRALPPGGYRLVVRARGAQRDAAALAIVVARGAVTPAALRKARRTVVCNDPVAEFSLAHVDGSDHEASGGGALGRVKSRILDPVGSAAGTVARTVREIRNRLDEGPDVRGGLFLTLVGAAVLASSILGALVLIRLVRVTGFRSYR